MKLAMHWEPHKTKGKVHCHLCPHNCVIAEDKVGICRVRKNVKGKLYSMAYGRLVATHVDPIEKKPLYHFLPGTASFSVGTAGCNLRCDHCQNWEISQASPGQFDEPEITPEKVVEMALESKSKSIAYTYTEPTIFYEYVYETAKLARKKGLKNIMVTNGFINKEPLEELYKYIDAANVDLKGFTEEFYKKICGARLKPVLETLKRLKQMGTVWMEITNLIIPTKNDDPKEIKEMCEWIVENVGKDFPLHFSRFFPYFKMLDIEPTPPETLFKARDIALKAGIKYVYVGNLFVDKEDNTYCPKCGELAVERMGFEILKNNIKDNKCKCGEEIKGVWG